MLHISFHTVTRLALAWFVGQTTLFLALGWIPLQNPLIMAICIVSATIQVVLAMYGLNSLFVLLKCLLARENPKKDAELRRQWGNREWPHVTVQLPIYNERYVIERLLESCIAMDYPSEKLEIQVLDDSTDGTQDIVKECIERLSRHTTIKMVHLTRNSRSNFKAGALVQGTSKARGEFLAIFDADFVPPANFLKRTIPRFAAESTGCVQCRWDHLNDGHSLLTRLQAMGHDGHFIIEQYAKSKSGWTLNFNGTAGVWRRQCIVDAGDWSGDTLAEDLDLSYRAQLKGWKIDFLREVGVPAEVPISISDFKKQQARWAKGSIQTALKLLPRVWDSERLDNMQKLQASIHLCGYGVHPLMLLNLVCTCTLFFCAPVRHYIAGLTYIVIMAALGPPISVAYAQFYLGRFRQAIYMPLLILLHHGLCFSNATAVLEALQGKKGAFERTPKFGAMSSRWSHTEYARALDRMAIPWGEIVLSVLLALTIAAGLLSDVTDVYTYPWLLFFLCGFLMIIFFHRAEQPHRSQAVGFDGKVKNH